MACKSPWHGPQSPHLAAHPYLVLVQGEAVLAALPVQLPLALLPTGALHALGCCPGLAKRLASQLQRRTPVQLLCCHTRAVWRLAKHSLQMTVPWGLEESCCHDGRMGSTARSRASLQSTGLHELRC
jgi:hypothetical protein